MLHAKYGSRRYSLPNHFQQTLAHIFHANAAYLRPTAIY
ncbi:MAG: hypothetical protein H6Q74_3160 [Firmicutes bacterium]|nr:hypothetical protein [Bacillota bacterium]